jgi:isopentenyl phosphate kinase
VETELLLIKLGGSVITHKNKAFSPNLHNLYEISKVLAEFWIENPTQMCLVHGGGGFAHVVARQYAVQSTFFSKNKLGISLVTWSARKLNDRVIESLVDYNLPVFPLQTSALIVMDNKKLKINMRIMTTIVDAGWIPVLYGDMLPGEKEARIVSGERILELLCKKFDVEKIIVCTNTDGVLRDLRKPEMGVIESINPTNMRSISRRLQSSSAIDITGGMKDKVRVLYRIARKMGVKSQIINGTNPLILKDCLHNKNVVCTWIEGEI